MYKDNTKLKQLRAVISTDLLIQGHGSGMIMTRTSFTISVSTPTTCVGWMSLQIRSKPVYCQLQLLTMVFPIVLPSMKISLCLWRHLYQWHRPRDHIWNWGNQRQYHLGQNQQDHLPTIPALDRQPVLPCGQQCLWGIRYAVHDQDVVHKTEEIFYTYDTKTQMEKSICLQFPKKYD